MNRLAPTLKADGVSLEFLMLIRTVLAATKEIAFRVSQGALSGILGSTLDENIQGETQKKLDVLALADQLGNVSEASRLSGVSRDTIYRHRRLFKEGGADALRRQETPNLRHKNRTDVELEELVIDFSLNNPHLRQDQVSRQLKERYSANISPNGVRYIWLRENMNTAALRLDKVELLPKGA